MDLELWARPNRRGLVVLFLVWRLGCGGIVASNLAREQGTAAMNDDGSPSRSGRIDLQVICGGFLEGIRLR